MQRFLKKLRELMLKERENEMESYIDKIITYVEKGDFSQFLYLNDDDFINGNVATELYQCLTTVKMYQEETTALYEQIDELKDFIRLLRKENKELRGDVQ